MKCLTISILYFALFSLFYSTCKALDVYNFINTRAYSMGNTLSVLPGFANPASQGFGTSRYLSLQYVNRYGLKGLSTWAGMVNYPNRFLNAGLYVSRFGMKAFHETSVSMNVYKKLSSYISLGVRVNYFNLHYSEKESNKSMVTGDVGILVSLAEHLNLSVLAINPLCTKMKIGEQKENLPAVFSVGASYEILDCFLLVGEIEKNLVLPVNCKLGLEYSPIKELSVRAGMFTNPFTPSFGVGLHFMPFTIDIAFSKHSALGFYSCCGLQFNF